MLRILEKCVGAITSLSSRYHPQTSGQSERANQDLESALRCVTTRHPWSAHLPWIEYAHNPYVLHYMFMAAQGFQLPLFSIQEEEIAVPSVQANLWRCCQVWKAACAALCCTSHQNQHLEDWLRTLAPSLGTMIHWSVWGPFELKKSWADKYLWLLQSNLIREWMSCTLSQ